MKIRKIDDEIFIQNYLSVAQIIMKLTDPTFLFGEVGRGSGKTTHILSPRLDRIQNDMPGSCLALGSATYKSIFDNILPGLMEYLHENYERGKYYEIGKEPPGHFNKCVTYIDDWKHTISFHTGTVVQFISCDRPESMLGKNIAHLLADELIKIPKDKFIERIIPALRADRSKFGHSHYFMGITGFSSTPNFETDEDWFLEYEKNMDTDLMDCIAEIAYNLDLRLEKFEIASKKLDTENMKSLSMFIERWSDRLREIRRGETFYMRASSFSNLKILGIDYIENQIKSIKDADVLNTSIFSVRKSRVKEMFCGKFGKQHLFDDSYNYNLIDNYSADQKLEETSLNLKHCDRNLPLYAGYDPGPFSSIVFAQRNKQKREFRAIKNFWVIHPEQHDELAQKIDDFFKNHRRKELFLHYDRAANQRDPKYRDYYALSGDISDTDAILLKKSLDKRGWRVHLMSKGQPVIFYSQHYRNLMNLFGKNEGKRDDVLIDRNECEALVSSINHSPLKRHEGKILLDKSSEKELEYKEQAYYSTQIFSAFMYLLWGEYNQLLPDSDRGKPSGMGSTFGA